MARRSVLTGLMCVASILAASPGARAQAVSAGQDKASCGPDLVKNLAGTWKAPEYKMKRASEIGTQVFGPNAFDIRNVELTLEPSGEGVLKISTSVLDQKGKAWAPTLVEAKLALTAPQTSTAGRCEPVVTVASVEERFLDETNYQTPLTGSHVTMVTDPAGKQIDVRFEPPRGDGSFWSTLLRQAPRNPRSPRAQPVQ